jgi:hypothetical protein
VLRKLDSLTKFELTAEMAEELKVLVAKVIARNRCRNAVVLNDQSSTLKIARVLVQKQRGEFQTDSKILNTMMEDHEKREGHIQKLDKIREKVSKARAKDTSNTAKSRCAQPATSLVMRMTSCLVWQDVGYDGEDYVGGCAAQKDSRAQCRPSARRLSANTSLETVGKYRPYGQPSLQNVPGIELGCKLNSGTVLGRGVTGARRVSHATAVFEYSGSRKIHGIVRRGFFATELVGCI